MVAIAQGVGYRNQSVQLIIGISGNGTGTISVS